MLCQTFVKITDFSYKLLAPLSPVPEITRKNILAIQPVLNKKISAMGETRVRLRIRSCFSDSKGKEMAYQECLHFLYNSAADVNLPLRLN